LIALLYIFFAASAAMVVFGSMYLIRSLAGRSVLSEAGHPIAKWVHIYSIGLGSLGLLSSAPSIFSDNPHWFVDKIYFAVSRLIEAFT
jgi:hypothetical protein